MNKFRILKILVLIFIFNDNVVFSNRKNSLIVINKKRNKEECSFENKVYKPNNEEEKFKITNLKPYSDISKKDLVNEVNCFVKIAENESLLECITKLNNYQKNSELGFFICDDKNIVIIDTLFGKNYYYKLSEYESGLINSVGIDGDLIYFCDEESKDLYVSFVKKICIKSKTFFIGCGKIVDSNEEYIDYISNCLKNIIKFKGIDKLKELISSSNNIDLFINVYGPPTIFLIEESEIKNMNLFKNKDSLFDNKFIEKLIQNNINSKIMNRDGEKNLFDRYIYGEKVIYKENTYYILLSNILDINSKSVNSYFCNLESKIFEAEKNNKNELFLKKDIDLKNLIDENEIHELPISLIEYQSHFDKKTNKFDVKSNVLYCDEKYEEIIKNILLDIPLESSFGVIRSVDLNHKFNDNFEFIYKNIKIQEKIYSFVTILTRNINLYKFRKLFKSLENKIVENGINHFIFLLKSDFYKYISHKKIKFSICDGKNGMIIYSNCFEDNKFFRNYNENWNKIYDSAINNIEYYKNIFISNVISLKDSYLKEVILLINE